MGPGQHSDGPTWVGLTWVGPKQVGRTTPATQSRKFENKSNKTRILAISILKLRPSLNAAAFYTYIVKFSDLKVVSFMLYTYNIQGRCDGTRHRQMMLVKVS